MLSLRNTSLIDPASPRVCVTDLASSLGLPRTACVRAVLDRRDTSRTTRWCVCLITYKNSGEIGRIRIPRALDRAPMPTSWFERVFSHFDGIAAYFRQMSGGRLLVEYQMFALHELLTIGQKDALVKSGGGEAESEWYRQALATQPGINIDSFDFFLWLPNETESRAGVNLGTHSFVGAVDFRPQMAMQEMVHAFGPTYHADVQTLHDRGDAFCVMGSGRGFENAAISFPDPGRLHDPLHSRTGPGICAPYLWQAGWLSGAGVWRFAKEELPDLVDGRIDLDANQGAPRGDTSKIALIIGEFPLTTAAPPNYWIEYRHPSGFDRDINLPAAPTAPSFPAEGVLLLRKVVFRDDTNGTGLYSNLVEVKGASPGSRLELPSANFAVRVRSVDAAMRRISLTVDRTG